MKQFRDVVAISKTRKIIGDERKTFMNIRRHENVGRAEGRGGRYVVEIEHEQATIHVDNENRLKFIFISRKITSSLQLAHLLYIAASAFAFVYVSVVCHDKSMKHEIKFAGEY